MKKDREGYTKSQGLRAPSSLILCDDFDSRSMKLSNLCTIRKRYKISCLVELGLGKPF